MNRITELQQKLIPDLLQQLGKRYNILSFIRTFQPVGRRNLAQQLGMTERILRSETEFLKQQGLLHISPAGMSLSQEGQDLIEEMDDLIHDLFGLNELEQTLQHNLAVNQVMIVPGDSATSPWVVSDLGRAAVEQMKRLAHESWAVTVGGGTTMAAIAEAMLPHPTLKSLLYLPARGGLGEEVEIQANTICSKMAQKTGGQYRLLHVPDELSKESYESLRHDTQIREVVRLIKTSRMIVHGIGEAKIMAKRRKSSTEIMRTLEQEHAVSEAFGYYFDQKGQIVHKIQTVGLRLDDVRNAEHIIAVAGGRDKAQAILSFLKHGVHDVLIIDEGAAREILSFIRSAT